MPMAARPGDGEAGEVSEFDQAARGRVGGASREGLRRSLEPIGPPW